jgi:hypothetical protein
MLFRDVIVVYCNNHMKHVNTPCVKNTAAPTNSKHVVHIYMLQRVNCRVWQGLDRGLTLHIKRYFRFTTLTRTTALYRAMVNTFTGSFNAKLRTLYVGFVRLLEEIATVSLNFNRLILVAQMRYYPGVGSRLVKTDISFRLYQIKRRIMTV